MRRSSPFQRDHIELMPVYNRAYGQNKFGKDGDIALSTHKKIIYLEKEIKTGDTLQSIALEYNVPVSELKRINNIHKENEIFARSIIKVPPNSLTLLLEKEYFSKSDVDKEEKSPVQSSPGNYDPIVETVNNSSCNPRTSEDNIREGDCEINYVFKNNKGNETQDESISLLNANIETNKNDVMSCNGADWGISWHILILFTLLLGVGGPVLYVFWFIWGKSHKAEGS